MKLWSLLVVALAGSLGACASESMGRDAPVASTSEVQPAGDLQDRYRLGVGDKVAVTIYGEEGLSGEQQVGNDGTISVSLIGQVKAAGRTVNEVSNEVRTRLSDGYLRNPSVNLTILSYRPFYILGEVNLPGQYAYTDGMTVIAAIARAQGFTYRARKNYIFLKREGQANEVRVELDSALVVQPGDTIRIGERYF